MDKVKVLIIEDDKEDYLLAKHYLKEINPDKYNIEWENEYEKAILMIAQQEHDVYLVDYNLGNNTGIELVRQATTSGILKPFIFLTGIDDLSVDEKALEAGAVDFLIKHKINKEILERSIRYAIRQKSIERELLESNNTKNKLFSIISHDLRSPLSTLVGSLELMAAPDSYFDGEMRKSILGELNKTTKTTLDLLDNLLSWARSQIGALRLEKEDLDLNENVQFIFQLLEGTRKQKSIEFINNIKEGTKIYSDKNALHLILRNLCSNAIKFTPEMGTIIVDAETHNGSTEVSVTDNGIGMDELAIQKLTRKDNFYSTVGTNDERGSGLGLVITREFIEKQGGEFKVKSSVGKGSTFTFILNSNK